MKDDVSFDVTVFGIVSERGSVVFQSITASDARARLLLRYMRCIIFFVKVKQMNFNGLV